MINALIIIDNLNVGGIASSLYNFLYYAKDRLDIDLLVFDSDSIEFEKIPKSVRIVQSSESLKMLGKNQKFYKDKSKLLYLKRGGLVALSKIWGGHFSRKFLFKNIAINKTYDCAFSYVHDDRWSSFTKGCVDFVLNNVNAKYKAAFIHCDYVNFNGFDKHQKSNYRLLDNIICVSLSCKKNFDLMFPKLANKTIVCENFINVDEIINKIKNSYKYNTDKIIFISVCRLSVVKGINRTIKIFYKLKCEGFNNFIWVIIGDGPERSKIEQLILELNLVDDIILFGESQNPYKYMYAATLFLLPSIHEAAPMVFGECASLKLPILTTNTCSARELVENRGVGIVCDNTEEGIYKSIKSILNNKIDLLKYRVNRNMDINLYAKSQFNELIKIIKKKVISFEGDAIQ